MLLDGDISVTLLAENILCSSLLSTVCSWSLDICILINDVVEVAIMMQLYLIFS